MENGMSFSLAFPPVVDSMALVQVGDFGSQLCFGKRERNLLSKGLPPIAKQTLMQSAENDRFEPEAGVLQPTKIIGSN